MKTCTRCKKEQLLENFNIRKNRGIRNSQCNKCIANLQRKNHKIRYENNKEKIKIQTSIYQKENPDKVKEWQKAYRYKNVYKIKEDQKKYRISNKDKMKNSYLIKNYNITLEDYYKILEKQNYCCAICRTDNPGNKIKYFHADHCHKNNIVRGLLCTNCNRDIGHLKDDIEIMKNAIDYLNIYEDKRMTTHEC